MLDRTPSKNAIIYCLKSALQSTDWASIKSVLTDSKTILLAYRPNEGSDQFIVLIHELYDIDSNLNWPTLTKFDKIIKLIPFNYFVLLVTIPISWIAYIYQSWIIVILNFTLLLVFITYRMFILAKFEKLMIDKINKTLEKLEELTILLEDYQKWLEWKDLQKTIISMRKEYQQKSPL